MLKYVLCNQNNDVICNLSVITSVINSDEKIPCDDITITMAYKNIDRINAYFLLAYSDEKLVFKGIVDEIENIKKSSGVITKITARSMASLLIDNEAEPLTYVNPTTNFLFNKLLIPLGFSEYTHDDSTYYGSLVVEKGMTLWQVINKFCILKYGTSLRVFPNGKVSFCGYNSEDNINFGFDEKSVNYYNLTEKYRVHKLISKVFIKPYVSSGYCCQVENNNPFCKNIIRQRYVNVSSDTGTINTADTIIQQGNLAYYEVTLTVNCCLANSVGKTASIMDNFFGSITNMVVSSIRYELGAKGESTVIVLRKGNLLCG